jgi:hypothetical protein
MQQNINMMHGPMNIKFKLFFIFFFLSRHTVIQRSGNDLFVCSGEVTLPTQQINKI